jgi:hypothetical protein
MDHHQFAVAAFDPAGALIGTGARGFHELSDKWLGICKAFLAAYGENFRAPWQGALAHLETRFTSSDGSALISFYANGILASSLALLSGRSAELETSMLQMFVRSLRETETVKACAVSEAPFEEVFGIAPRPLMVVVPWGNERVSDEDHGLLRELAVHLSGAFFLVDAQQKA